MEKINKMRTTIILLVLILNNPSWVKGQEVSIDKEILKKLADDIVENTNYKFYNTETNETFEKITPQIPVKNVKLSSPYTDWKYWNGVLNIGLLKYAQYTGQNKYKEVVFKNYDFAFKHKEHFTKYYPKDANRWHHPFGLFITTNELDDCGAMGGGLIEVYKEDKRKEYKKYIDHAADHMLNKQHRLEDGTFVRIWPFEYTLWADDLYMSIVFLSRMGKLTGEQKYFDDAIKQVHNFTKHLFNDQTQLYYHCYFSEEERNGVAHWGRCNGWVMLAQADLLEHLPKDHPQRDTLISIFEQQIIGASRYQTGSGLWHQLLNKEDSYLETSVSAMFAYSIAKGINSGWIDKRYASIAQNAWKGIKTRINADGKIEGICQGTGIDESLSYYYNRPTPVHDIHGLGAVLMAGIEILQLSDK
jgi:rhamnogalacturonyl hydrolase YesR